MERVPKGWWTIGALVAVTSGVLLWQGLQIGGNVPTSTEAGSFMTQPSPPQPSSPQGSGETEPVAPSAPAGTSPAVSEEIVVHVAGAVKNPGVVRIPRGSRVDDAVRAAGGFSAQADPDSINLAQPLEDGVQVYVPRKGDTVQVEGRVGSVSSVDGSGRSSSAPQELSSGKVNLNTASIEQLEALPGIGPVTARAIIEYRKQNGGFRSVDELIEVHGIGPRRLEQIRPHVVVR
ncbi:MAG: helix-hairpin-helix domain-containing protein [Armatimonadota bacterium]|nr:helix-hairpin-helix domain-containing protein [Armatimonadota bacterium]